MSDFKEVRDRAFALSGAILFFVTSMALTAVVIVQMVQDNHKNKEAAKEAASQVKINDNKGALKGTKLEGFTPVDKVAELKTTDLQPGTGKEVTSASDTVTADYTGAVAATGVIFESSLDSGQPLKTPLSGVIKGWQQGMIGMKEGGKRQILIPASEAYADSPPPGSGIPANAALVFDVTLHSVSK